MSGKDVLKLLLISYGFKDISISSYKGEGNWIGYNVIALKDNIRYSEENCEGLLFHIYCINKFMIKNNISPKPSTFLGNYTTKDLLKLTNEQLKNLK